MLYSKDLKRISILIEVGATVVAIITGLLSSWWIGLIVWAVLSGTPLIYQFGAAVLHHLEVMSDALQTIKESSPTAKRAYSAIHQASDIISAIESADDFSDHSEPAPTPIPDAPPKNEEMRIEAMNQAKSTGFKSTSKFKSNDYTIALDAKRREWIIIPPDGQPSGIHPFSAYRHSRVNENDGRVEVQVFYSDSSIQTCHIVLMNDVSSRPFREAIEDANRMVTLLSTMKASIK